MSLRSIWSQMSGIDLPTYQTGWQMPIIDGQSQALGFNGTLADRAQVDYMDRAAVKMLTGLQRSDDAPVFIHGPLAGGYNAVPSTGIVYASTAANTPACFLFALGVDKWRRHFSRPLYQMVVGFNGVSGQAIAEFDRDNLTGVLGTVIRDSHSRWISEVLSFRPSATPLVYGMIQGEADVAMTRAAYRAAATESYTDALDDIEGLTGIRPPLLLWQTGGFTNSGTDPYGSTLAQLDLVGDFGGLMAGPQYPYKNWDNIGHPGHEESIIMCEVGAYVWVRHEMGQNLSILPGMPVVSGNQVTIPFSGLETGKSLTFDTDNKYAAYGGLSDHGVTISGTTVSSVTLSGNAVTITAADILAGRTLGIAMQQGDVRGSADGNGANYAAHRCDIMESAPPSSQMVAGRSLKRFLPSCQFAL